MAQFMNAYASKDFKKFEVWEYIISRNSLLIWLSTNSKGVVLIFDTVHVIYVLYIYIYIHEALPLSNKVYMLYMHIKK